MLRLTPLQVVSVVKIAPGRGGSARSMLGASNDAIARAAIIAPGVNVFISFISIFLGSVCFRATVLTATQEKFSLDWWAADSDWRAAVFIYLSPPSPETAGRSSRKKLDFP